jgi:hypothetical protein
MLPPLVTVVAAMAALNKTPKMRGGSSKNNSRALQPSPRDCIPAQRWRS